MNFLVIVGTVVGLLSQVANAKTGGFTSTSFISTSGGRAAGAAESSVLGPDGIRKGECFFTDSEGRSITIKYEETANGVVTATTNSDHTNDAKAELNKCRDSIGTLQHQANVNLQNTQQEIEDGFREFDDTFQSQMASFNRQQLAFEQQHLAFMKQMDDFNRKIQSQFGTYHRTPAYHYQRYNPFRIPFF